MNKPTGEQKEKEEEMKKTLQDNRKTMLELLKKEVIGFPGGGNAHGDGEKK